jgi:hypothetical protein
MPSEFSASERHHIHAWLDILLLRTFPTPDLDPTLTVEDMVGYYKLEDKEKVRL